MRRHLRSTLACAVVVPAAVVLAGCGGLSADSVADVDGTDVTKAQYDQYFKYETYKANGPTALQGKDPKLIQLDAPGFANCVAALRKQVPKPAKGQPATPDSQLKQQCKTVHDQVKQTAFFDPIVQIVLDKEAEDAGVKITDAELQKGWDAFLTQNIGGKKYLPVFLRLTGLKDDALLRKDQRYQLQLQKIQEKVQKDAKVTDKDVQAYYEKNKAQFTTPETRGLHVVLTKTEAKAQAAKKALEGGAKFADVAKKYSVDQVTRNAGGKLAGVAKGQQERGLEDAAFKAAKGALVGPVKTESGFYVIRVDNITPAKTTPLAQVKTLLTQQLQSEKQQTAFVDWQKDVVERWKKKTECREGYSVPFCKDYEEPKTTTAAGAPADPTGGAAADPTGGGAADPTGGAGTTQP